MKMVAATLLFCLSGLTARAQEESVPPGEQQTYKTVDGLALHLWVAKPSGTSTRTAIVFFHGGGWTGGTVTQFNRQTKELTQRGMLVVNVQYRLVAKAPSLESPKVCLEDAKSAMRWVRSHAKKLNIDPDRIVGSGGSAGGYLAAATALVGTILRTICLSPPSPTRWCSSFLLSTLVRRHTTRSALATIPASTLLRHTSARMRRQPLLRAAATTNWSRHSY